MRGRPYLIKLVRDKIGDLLGDSQILYQSVPPEQAAELRRDKLLEEVLEFYKHPSASEAADIWTALTDCLPDIGVELNEVFYIAYRKRQERGGFAEGMGMYAFTLSDGTHDSPEKR
jgi:predicted house-cleaning noncanonical NTP pyrophosphatase (MazG superfamily)